MRARTDCNSHSRQDLRRRPGEAGFTEEKLKILIASDCWVPYISGQALTFAHLVERLRERGHDVEVITPYMFTTIPLPHYPAFRMPIWVKRKVYRIIEGFQPDAIHLATEGTVGCAARRWCVQNDMPFTTSYTTKLPEYIRSWFGVPLYFGYMYFRWFHGAAAGIMVSTDSFRRELTEHGFKNLTMWSRGVDTERFHPRDREALSNDFMPDPRPVYLYVGRIAKEKNLPAFLNMKVEGTKYVVGDGPLRSFFAKQYPEVQFVGPQDGEDLARYYAAADVFVFPSKLDTFGLVLLESLASGTPVAAYPVTGPLDVIGDSGVGVLDDDLQKAAVEARAISREKCREHAEQFTWDRSVDQFLGNLCLKSSADDSVEEAGESETGAASTKQRQAG